MSQKRFSVTEVCLIIVTVAVLVAVGYYIYQGQTKNTNSTDNNGGSPNDNSGYVVYEIDHANTCTWKDGKVNTSTQVGNLNPLPKQSVKLADEPAFIKDAASKNLCAYRID